MVYSNTSMLHQSMSSTYQDHRLCLRFSTVFATFQRSLNTETPATLELGVQPQRGLCPALSNASQENAVRRLHRCGDRGHIRGYLMEAITGGSPMIGPSLFKAQTDMWVLFDVYS